MMISIIKKYNKTIALVAIAAIGIFASLANTSEYKDYVRQAKHRADSLYNVANKYYNKNVKPLKNKSQKASNNNEEAKQEEMLNEYQTLHSDSLNYVRMLRDTVQLNRLKATIDEQVGNDFDLDIKKYIDELRTSQCNPEAIKALEGCDRFLGDRGKKYYNKNFKPLMNYERYCQEMKTVLDTLYMDLAFSDWGKPEEDVLKRFDKDWKNISYFKVKKDERIPYLDTIEVQVKHLREFSSFEGSESSVVQIMNNLTPQDDFISSRPAILDDIAKYNVVYDKVNSATNKLEQEIIPRIDTIWAYFQGVASTSDELYENTENWYNIREELDNHLVDICKYCLSQPCDTLGNFQWLYKQIEPMLDSVYHKSYTKQIKELRVLLDDYDNYTIEIGEFLKRNYKYTKIDGGLTEKQRTSIMNDFNGLKYMKYYNQRNKSPKEKPVYSPHLNNILQEFQRMVDSGFKNSKERYIKLGSELRNKSVAQLDKNAPKALKNNAVESANHKEPESDIFKKKDSKHNNSKQDKPDLEDSEETNEGTSITPLN